MSDIPLRSLRRPRKQNARSAGYTPLNSHNKDTNDTHEEEMHTAVAAASVAASRSANAKGKRKAVYVDNPNSDEQETLLGEEAQGDAGDGFRDVEHGKDRAASKVSSLLCCYPLLLQFSTAVHPPSLAAMDRIQDP
jgi:hypothetical protein